MRNDLYTLAISAYKAGIITLAELHRYLAEYGLDRLYSYKV